jgi:hypothetical protein
MSAEIGFVIAIATLALALNAYATFRIWRNDLLEPTQRIAQTAIVWVLPFLGALVVLWFLREEKFEAREYIPPTDRGFPPESWH